MDRGGLHTGRHRSLVAAALPPGVRRGKARPLRFEWIDRRLGERSPADGRFDSCSAHWFGLEFQRKEDEMLVLSRKRDEKVVIVTPSGDEIVVCVTEIRGDRARLGVEAPKNYAIHREEVIQAIRAEGAAQPA